MLAKLGKPRPTPTPCAQVWVNHTSASPKTPKHSHRTRVVVLEEAGRLVVGRESGLDHLELVSVDVERMRRAREADHCNKPTATRLPRVFEEHQLNLGVKECQSIWMSIWVAVKYGIWLSVTF